MNARFISRTVIASLLGLTMLAGAAADYPFERVDIKALTELLELDAYQAGEVERILAAQREKIRAAIGAHQKEEQEGNEDDHTLLKQLIEEARSEARQKLALILNAEQLARYEGYVRGRERHR